MTVIEFQKRERNNIIVLTALVLGICAAFIIGIFLYNTIARLRQDIAQNTQNMERVHVQNAELKNELYRYLDEAAQESFLQSRGLVVEKNPRYAPTSETPIVASQRP